MSNDNLRRELLEDEGIPIHELFRQLIDPDADEEEFKLYFKERIESVCKPCWELKYCPYGSLVELFPLPGTLKKDLIEHNEYLKRILKAGKFDDGTDIDERRRILFEEDVKNFNPDEGVDKLSQFEIDASCSFFGHLCPVFFVNEPFTETEEMRRIGRYIPFKTKIRVSRRDNYTCQICGKHLKDTDLEFDHIIPVSKGGSSEEHNIRLSCFNCNRSKSDKIDL